MALTFNRFLRDHADEQSRFGDLARDYIQDCRERGVKSMSVKAVKESLEDNIANSDCWDTFEEAVEVWQAARKREIRLNNINPEGTK